MAANISEILSHLDPESFKKLVELRDKIPHTGISQQQATENAYKQLFSKQTMQDLVNSSSLPGKTAADSAEVFAKALPEGIAEANQIVPYSQIATTGPRSLALAEGKELATLAPSLLKSSSMLSKALPFAGKALGAASLASNFYGDLADPSEIKPEPVPGRPGYFFRGPDIVKMSDDATMASEPKVSASAAEAEVEESVAPPVKRNLASPPNPMGDENAPPPPESSMSDVISKLMNDDDANLTSAKEARNMNQLMAILGKAGSQIGSSIARVGPADTSGFDALLKLASQPVDDIKQGQDLKFGSLKNKQAQELLKNEMAKQDPNSPISKIGREIMAGVSKQAGQNFEVPESLSLSNMEKLLPGLEAMANRRLVAQATNDRMSSSRKADQDKETIKLATKMGEDLDPSRFRSGEMGKNQGRINAAGRIDALMQQFPDGNIPKIQTRELATAISGLLSNGNQTSVTQINELVPHTWRGSANSMAEWITGKPKGQEQQAFMKMFVDTAHREKETAQDQIIEAQFKKAYSTHNPLKNKSPDDFYNNLSVATGLDPETIQKMEKNPNFKKGQYRAAQRDVSPETVSSSNISDNEARIQSFMKANNIKDKNEAIKILKEHGHL